MIEIFLFNNMFFDIILILVDGKFDFNFYIKFIDFYFYLMMFSCYLFYMFRGILKGLVIRVRCICLI